MLTIRCLIETLLLRNITVSSACSCWIVGSKCVADKETDALVAALSYSFRWAKAGNVVSPSLGKPCDIRPSLNEEREIKMGLQPDGVQTPVMSSKMSRDE